MNVKPQTRLDKFTQHLANDAGLNALHFVNAFKTADGRRQLQEIYPRSVLSVLTKQHVADASFKEFVLDQLRALPELRARAMFGAQGLYSGEKFFGILDEGRLFFKTNAQSQADYTSRRMGAFTYESKGKLVTMSYHEVPPDIFENAPELTAWAQRAIQVATVADKPKRKKSA
jgi:DNA transformation protein